MNCIIIDDDNLSSRLIEEYILKTDDLKLIGSFLSPKKAIKKNSLLEKIDIIFLDVEFPGMTGFDLLKSLEKPPSIIIISSKGTYAVEAFSFEVVDFLLKPISYERFYKAIQKTISINKSKEASVQQLSDEVLFIKKNNNSFVKIKYNDIYYIEAMENYALIKTNSHSYTIHLSMKTIEEKLPANIFKRIHRSYIVNLKKIHSIEKAELFIENNHSLKALPIGRYFKNQILNAINSI